MKPLTYKKSGVDIDKANFLIEKIKPLVKSTKRSGWVSNIGAFAGFFKLDLSKYKNPIIVASTDGVGTKLLMAKMACKHDTIGVDLVAMSVNDIITCGAEPLFFLDYFATGKLSVGVTYDVIKGITKACKLSNCALIGGETAELPGMYKKDEYDLAGFSIGIVEKKRIIDGSRIKNGNLILGIPSSGLHSNGYTLARKVFSGEKIKPKLMKSILKPTRIYVKPILDVTKRFRINAISHITGGGFYDNIERLLPKNIKAVIFKGTWPVLPIFKLIREKGCIRDEEMFKTFNMGIGMALIIPRTEILKVKRCLLKKHKLESYLIGEVIKSPKKGVEII